MQAARAQRRTVAGRSGGDPPGEHRRRPDGLGWRCRRRNRRPRDEDLDVNGPLLAPGFGAQGGTPDDVRRIFAGVTQYVVPSSSRGVLAAGPEVRALRNAARHAADEIAIALGSG